MPDVELNLQDIQMQCVVRIVDDDDGVRRSFRYLLEGDGWLVRTYSGAEEFLSKDHLQQAGCVLLDVRMGGISGLELQKQLQTKNFHPRIIFLSAHGTIPMAVQTIKDGAVDFLTKPVDEDVLLNKVEAAARLSLRQKQQQDQDEILHRIWRQLSVRETQVAEALVEGLPNKLVADRLGIAERTVQLHRANLLQKLGIRSTAELATCMMRLDRTNEHDPR